jgi:hypothetical protein
LQEFTLETKGEITLPKVFIFIYDYFDEDVKRLRVENLFKQKAKTQDVDTLEKHVAFGNYNKISEISKPHVVATYFKCILKYMAEPLCSFKLYSQFKTICKGNGK